MNVDKKSHFSTTNLPRLVVCEQQQRNTQTQIVSQAKWGKCVLDVLANDDINKRCKKYMCITYMFQMFARYMNVCIPDSRIMAWL